MAQAYESLSEWFETLNDDCDYALWSQYFISGLRRLHMKGKGLELGCGSGAFSRALTKAGFVMSGCDISSPMLSKAERLAREGGLKIPFFRADAASLKTPEKYSFILSPNDCFNYIPQGKLESAFKNVSKRLEKEGIFWFDVSSEYKFRTKFADTVSADDREEVTYLAFHSLHEKHVELDVTLFVKRADGAFERFDEKHIQYIHREEDILSALEGAGFEVLTVEGHLGEKKENNDRLNFICRKV